MAIEAEITIVVNKLLNLIHSKRTWRNYILPRQINEAVRMLETIYTFLIREECQEDDSHRNWKDRLLIAIHKVEDAIDMFLGEVAQQEQKDRVNYVPNAWVILVNKCTLHRSVRQFIKAINGLSEDQHLVDPAKLLTSSKSQPSDPNQHNRPDQTQFGWVGVSCSIIDIMIELDNSQKKTTQYEGMSKLKKQLIKKEYNGNIKETGPKEKEYRNNLVIVMVGPDGVGKTCITRAVSNLPGIKGRFQCRVWIQMLKNTDYKNVLLRVLNQVTHRVPMNPEDMHEHNLAEIVYKELIRKSVLIVLEDAEGLDVLSEFLGGLPDLSPGSRIIITTKFESIAPHFADTTIKLDVLTENYPDVLFNKIIGDRPKLPNNVTSIMLKSCGGSPLKISLLGKLISCSKSEEWMLSVNQQGSSSSSDIDVYGMCYNKLPPHIKPCFLYLCIFPKSFPIPVRRILRLWISEDLIQIEYDHQNRHLEDIAESYLQEMVKRNLVEVVTWKRDGTPHACHMNTNLYEAFLPSACKTGLFHVREAKLKPTTTKSKNQQLHDHDNVRWLVETEFGDRKGHHQLLSNMSSLPRSFMSFSSRKGILSNDLGRLFKTLTSKRNFGMLKVLDLEGVYKPDLGNSLQKLLLLRYLGLRSTGLDSLPKYVSDLPYLETLDVKHTNVTRLPSSIWKMRYIRHLNLNNLHFSKARLKDFSRAGFLSTLTTLTGFNMACHINEHVLSIDPKVLINLTKLGITFHNPQNHHDINEIGKWISNLTSLRSLKLRIIGSTRKEDDEDGSRIMLTLNLSRHQRLFNVYLLGKLQNLETNKFPSCLRVLTLSLLNLANDPMGTLGAPNAQLPHLRELRLLADSYTGKEMTCPTGSFPNLLVLKLWKLKYLKKIVVKEGSLVKLEHLEIRFCPEFELVEGAQHLKAQLKELILYRDPDKKKEAQKIKDCMKDNIPDLYVGENDQRCLDEEDEYDNYHRMDEYEDHQYMPEDNDEIADEEM